MVTKSKKLFTSLKKSGIDFVIGVPCINLKTLINILENNEKIKYVSVTREEEGVGICAGLWIGGKKSVLLIQNSGLGNSINALMSLNKLYSIPIVMLISHRGIENEKMIGQIPMGSITCSILKTMNVLYYYLSDITNIESIIENAFKNNEAVAILIAQSYWE